LRVENSDHQGSAETQMRAMPRWRSRGTPDLGDAKAPLDELGN
jgi:hypothetical protein